MSSDSELRKRGLPPGTPSDTSHGASSSSIQQPSPPQSPERKGGAQPGATGKRPTSPSKHHDTPDRRAAFQRYAEHADSSFRTELFEERPRTVLMMFIGLAILMGLAVWRGDPSAADSRANAQAGFVAAVIIFAIYAATQFKDGLMVRPHPMFWRITHSFGVVYLVMLAVVFVQDLEGARSIVRLFSPQVIGDFKPVDPFASPSVSLCVLITALIMLITLCTPI